MQIESIALAIPVPEMKWIRSAGGMSFQCCLGAQSTVKSFLFWWQLEWKPEHLTLPPAFVLIAILCTKESIEAPKPTSPESRLLPWPPGMSWSCPRKSARGNPDFALLRPKVSYPPKDEPALLKHVVEFQFELLPRNKSMVELTPVSDPTKERNEGRGGTRWRYGLKSRHRKWCRAGSTCEKRDWTGRKTLLSWREERLNRDKNPSVLPYWSI